MEIFPGWWLLADRKLWMVDRQVCIRLLWIPVKLQLLLGLWSHTSWSALCFILILTILRIWANKMPLYFHLFRAHHTPALKCKGKILFDTVWEEMLANCLNKVAGSLFVYMTLYILHMTSKKSYVTVNLALGSCLFLLCFLPHSFPLESSWFSYIAFSLPLSSGTSQSYVWHSFLLFWPFFFFPLAFQPLLKHHPFYFWTQ